MLTKPFLNSFQFARRLEKFFGKEDEYVQLRQMARWENINKAYKQQ